MNRGRRSLAIERGAINGVTMGGGDICSERVNAIRLRRGWGEGLAGGGGKRT